jgi:hypothetical protein
MKRKYTFVNNDKLYFISFSGGKRIWKAEDYLYSGAGDFHENN